MAHAAACSLEPHQPYGRARTSGTTLRLQVGGAPRTYGELDPARAHSATARGVAMELFRGLVALDGVGDPQPDLAASWSMEGARLRLVLAPDLRFSNGDPITTTEVLWSWRRALRPSTGTQDLRPFLIFRHGEALVRRRMRRVGMEGATAHPAPFPTLQRAAVDVKRSLFQPGEAVVVLDTNARAPCCDAPVQLWRDVPAPGAAPEAAGTLLVGEVGVVVGVHALGDAIHLQLRAPGGAVGWAADSALAVHVPEPGIVPVVDHGGGVLLRAGPDEDAPVRGVLEDEDLVEIVETDGPFMGVVVLKSGARGFVARDDVDTDARERAWLRVRALASVVGADRTWDAQHAAELAASSDAESPHEQREGWLREDALVFDPALLDAQAIDDRSLVLHLAPGTSALEALGTLAAPVLRPVPPRTVAAHGHGWTEPTHIAVSGAFKPKEEVRTAPHDLALVLVPTVMRGGVERVELYSYARDITALHLYRVGFLDGILDGGLPRALIPALAQAPDFVPGPGGGALISVDVRGLPAVPLDLRAVTLHGGPAHRSDPGPSP